MVGFLILGSWFLEFTFLVFSLCCLFFGYWGLGRFGVCRLGGGIFLSRRVEDGIKIKVKVLVRLRI